MTRLFNRAVAALVLASLAACQSVGNGRAFEQSGTDRAQTLRPGVTTRDDLRRDLGEAQVYQFDDGCQTWAYQSTTGIPRWVQFVPYLGLLPLGNFSHTRELALLFDPRGILRKFEWHVSDTTPSPGAPG